MTLLIVSPSSRIGHWLDSLCADSTTRRTTCADITEAVTIVAQGETNFDWILIDAGNSLCDPAVDVRLRLAGCRSPIVMLHFSEADSAAAASMPTLLCIVENRDGGPRILGCRLGSTTCQAADDTVQTIFEYRGPGGPQAANG